MNLETNTCYTSNINNYTNMLVECRPTRRDIQHDKVFLNLIRLLELKKTKKNRSFLKLFYLD